MKENHEIIDNKTVSNDTGSKRTTDVGQGVMLEKVRIKSEEKETYIQEEDGHE